MSNLPLEEDNEGLRQFIAFDSEGIRPENPHPYFLVLDSGKRWWNWHKTGMRENFLGINKDDAFLWPGLYQLREDYMGEMWILKMLLDWWPYEFKDWFFTDKEWPLDENGLLEKYEKVSK